MEATAEEDKSGFLLQGTKPPTRERKSEDYMTNTQKTISSLNLNASLSENKDASPIDLLQESVDNLKLDMKTLNDSLKSKYGGSQIYHDDDDFPERVKTERVSEENPELTYMFQRTDEEAVLSELPPPGDAAQWYNSPEHLTKETNNYPVSQLLGVTDRSVGHVTRSHGRLGAEIATKDLDGNLNMRDLASDSDYFPVRLTAPHIVGVRSLLPPKYSVRGQNPQRSKSFIKRSKSVEPKILFGGESLIQHSSVVKMTSGHRDRSLSPKPVWMPTTPKPNHVGHVMEKFSKSRGRKNIGRRRRPSTANGNQLSKYLNITKTYDPSSYGLQQLPKTYSEVELKFLKSADQLDTRSCLVDNSPYQQALAKLRLERLRVEEEYLLQLKRESELERIRGPKPKWYESKGPQFHYECSKNTELHRSRDNWSDSLEYRRKLLSSSREFAASINGPVMSSQY